MKATPVIEVACALIEDAEGRVLIAQRPAGKHLAGLWEFPGGKLEPGETPEAALIREIREELGCEIESGRALGAVTHRYETVFVCLRPYLARLKEPEKGVSAREHAALRWVGPEEIGAVALSEADGPIVAEWIALRGGGAGRAARAGF